MLLIKGRQEKEIGGKGGKSLGPTEAGGAVGKFTIRKEGFSSGTGCGESNELGLVWDRPEVGGKVAVINWKLGRQNICRGSQRETKQ